MKLVIDEKTVVEKSVTILPCRCGGKVGILTVKLLSLRAAVGIWSMQCQVNVVCEICQRKIRQRAWTEDLRKLVSIQLKQYRPTFYEQFGKILIIIALITLVFSLIFIKQYREINDRVVLDEHETQTISQSMNIVEE